MEALSADLITQGPRVESFEAALARLTGAKFAVAVSSGTAALHAAYSAAGIGPGKSVLTTPITFAATANASRYLGGDVAFADVETRSVLLDPERCGEVRDERIAAVAPVHFAGSVAPMLALRALAKKSGWLVIEDAAHALGASYLDETGRERIVGSCSHSDLCCFSFHPVKHVTTGEGGAVTTNDKELYERLLLFRTHGIVRDRQKLEKDDGAWYYEQQSLGFNYRITDIQCALGESQMKRLPQFIARRRAVAARYDDAFSGAGTIRRVEYGIGKSSHHLYVIRVAAAERKRIFDRLRARDIGVNVHYIPVHKHPYYQATGFRDATFPEAESYYGEAISLPMYGTLSEQDQERVISEVLNAVGG